MTTEFKLQQNVKVGNDLINLRADSPDEFGQIADWVIENAAKFVSVAAALNSVPPALAANVTSTQVIQQPVQTSYAPDQSPPPQSQWGQPQQSSPPPWAGQQQAPVAQGPSCMHGPMEWKDFTSKAGNHVQGHFCTSRNSSCPPVYAPKARG